MSSVGRLIALEPSSRAEAQSSRIAHRIEHLRGRRRRIAHLTPLPMAHTDDRETFARRRAEALSSACDELRAALETAIRALPHGHAGRLEGVSALERARNSIEQAERWNRCAHE